MLKKKFCFLFVFILFNQFLLNFSASFDLKFDRSINKGLIQKSILCLLQDKDGFIWIGSFSGLTRFDGYSYKYYTHNSFKNNSISSNIIRTIFEDKSGNLWIGTERGGINLFNKKNETFKHFTFENRNLRKINNATITSINQDKTGTMWFGVFDVGLVRYNLKKNHWKIFNNDINNPQSLSSNKISRSHVDSNGVIWVGTADKGLNSFNYKDENFTHFLNDPDNKDSILSNKIGSILEDSKNRLWIGTGKGLDLYDKTDKKFVHFINDYKDSNILNNTINVIFEDRNKNIWLGTDYGLNKLVSIKNRFFETYLNNSIDNYSLSDNKIWSIINDRSGNMFIGTFFKGMNVLKPGMNKFRHINYTNSNTRKIGVARTIIKDESGILWVGTREGVLLLSDNNKQFKKFKYTDKLDISYLYEDSKKDIWIGTWGSGLIRYNKKREKVDRFDFSDGIENNLGNNFISCINEDQNSNLWISTNNGGIARLNKKNNKFTQLKNVPIFDGLYSICIIKKDHVQKNILWLGTYKNGIWKYDYSSNTFTKLFARVKILKKINRSFIQAIHFFEKDSTVLWIGTYGDGLFKFNQITNKLKNYTIENGLPIDNLYGILEDKKGTLWISTDNGISNFDPKTEKFNNFYESDGLQGNEFNQDGYYKDSDGCLYFGGLSGYNAFYPEEFKKNTVVPQIVITSFSIFNKEVKLNQSISGMNEVSVLYRDNMFTFEFSALDYTNPEKNKYAYKLVDFNKQWIYTSALNRSATFTNIPPGEYVFRVKGSNNDGIWNEEGVSIRVIIIPPIWKTLWFKLIMIILVILILFVFYQRRIKKIEEKMWVENKKNKLCIRFGISEREKQVLDLLLAGKSNKQIEEILFIALGTVKNHVHKILSKLEVKSRNELIIKFNKEIKDT